MLTNASNFFSQDNLPCKHGKYNIVNKCSYVFKDVFTNDEPQVHLMHIVTLWHTHTHGLVASYDTGSLSEFGGTSTVDNVACTIVAATSAEVRVKS